MKLTNKQQKYLRTEAQALKPIFQVGKNGVNPNLVTQVRDALEARELVKITILQNCPEDKKQVAQKLSERSESTLVQVIGFTIILFKPAKENSMLPEA
ncbi:ribosome assembly RNA-binding protein YhbY [Salicibibacter cibarius]|uniref:Ribosome assembly RNA-binding protein YhbY n=1 Tax=Salicibibacter cibarius TaxID=2743000 RepID=A0A7T7CBB2_9BACI|nr:ribosome assembly RNA-binding protein YhbY [Salicibibacter cibarius]QQK75794.1 ribosome assembly RNA-binding protein YhbY [Salicibibacter cibarius]